MNRYERQINQIGKENQEKLDDLSVGVIGLGALGSVTTELLARAGVNELIIADHDIIELSNLHRQVLYNEEDVDSLKTEVISKKLENINSATSINIFSEKIDEENIGLFEDVDILLDCSDDLTTRFIINDFCSKENIDWIHASVSGMNGIVLPVKPESDYCFNCIYDTKKTLLDCDEQGILNTASHVISSIQVNELFKIVFDNLSSEDKLSLVDLESNSIESFSINLDNECKTCNNIYEYLRENEKSEGIEFSVSKCETRAAFSANTNENISLDLENIEEKFSSEVSTPIVVVIKDESIGEVIVHEHGELIFKDLEEKSKIREEANRIYEMGL